MAITRRNLIRCSAAGLAAAAAGLAPGAGRAAGPLPDLPGEYGRRLRSAGIKAVHLHNQPADGPLHQTLVELWDQVFERTGGALLVTPLPNDANLPGADADAVNRVADGTFHLVSTAAPITDRLLPDVGLQSLPYVFRSSREVLDIVNTDRFAAMTQAALEGTSLVYLPNGTFSNGMRVTTTGRARPLRTLSDFAGLKIRTPPSQDLQEVMRTLGAVPVPMGINEVYDALAAGRVDAQENPVTIIKGFRLYEVAHWINLTNHAWSGFNTLANRAFWTGLPDRYRSAILEALPAYQALQVERQEKSNADLLEALKAQYGMEIVATDSTDAQRLMAPVYRAMNQAFGPEARRLAEPLIGRFL
jgi:tripartite ATP-independent transporter DctP family solute receptor